MDTIQRDIPPQHLGYQTLVGPSTFTQYCFPPDCPDLPFTTADYSSTYTNKQIEDFNVGLQRFMDSRQIERDNFPAACPVYMSYMGPPSAGNYLRYEYPGKRPDY